jgi:type 2 lantibiotic biosynthesis protein LanM
MEFPELELREIAARATPLLERPGTCVPCSGNEVEAVARLERWSQAFSVEGDKDILARRVAFDGFDLQTVQPWLGRVQLKNDKPVPPWAQRLNSLLRRCCANRDVGCHARAEGPAADLLGEHPWAVPFADWASSSAPFWEVWVPFVTSAREELSSTAGNVLDNLSEGALRSFQAELLGTLAYIASLALGLEFRRFVARNDPLSVLEQPPPVNSPASRELYDRFVSELQRGGMLGFLQDYAVLGRLIAVVVSQWTDHVTEFCRRVEEDRRALASVFNGGSDPGQLVELQLGLSDPHNGRRSVLIPTFASGLRLVYKPKDLAVDDAYSRFIDWLNAHGAPVPLHAIRVLNRGTHGWVEFLNHERCRNACEIERYFKRIGVLVALAYVLGGTDFHQGNLIACGEHPVLVDLETMFQALPRPWDALKADSADHRAIEVIIDSVLRTGLLPFWIVANPGKSYDVSGIGGEEQIDSGYMIPVWQDINTDRMHLVRRSVQSTRDYASRPMLTGQSVSAEDYATAIVEGFDAGYECLLAHRDDLLADAGPLSWFRGVKVRSLLRMTKSYAQISNRCLHPEFLRDAADAGIEMDRLARDFVVVQQDLQYRPPWDVFRAELQSLERLDIPFFTLYSDSSDLLANDRVVAHGFFAGNGWESAVTRVRKLGSEDLKSQTDFIVTSLHARYDDLRSHHAARAAGEQIANDEDTPLTPAELIAAASSIAEQLRSAAIRGRDSGVTWLSMSFDPTVDRMNLRPMSDSLYDGRIGVAFFLAALEHVTGGAGVRDLALAALLPRRKALQHPLPPVMARTMLGGAAGLASHIYGLVRAAKWLSDDELLALAAREMQWFTSQRIASDQALDVVGGSAGGILGLLTLSAAGANGNAVDVAFRCGEHLLNSRVPTDTGHRAWPAAWTQYSLTGFGHGAAGIAYALLRLSNATGEACFRDAAEEAIAYETAVYSPGAQNWPDFRVPSGPDGPRCMVAWCNGAAGIGLARLGGLPVLDNLGVRDDISNSIQTTIASPLSGHDHVCCGNFGRLELLIEAALRLGRPDLLDETRWRSAVLVRRAKRKGQYRFFAEASGTPKCLSLFQGIAGIGYELLRLAAPDRLPCLLLWQ